ncbi:hypothetical protein AKJ65_03910 [candidate division MSBL1 archaeon SCGC-AAA259E19]|uniref:Uncharacterized protein n=1 Tax=candidate division MSBL1 archaeon SCGC-AAA259E19 TaxID=1698264 RepID=A0A133UK81_9EURY|nr:hypothetical protein AKJ65_03910 [candidate division MSBL1 archaeon SCGC-AAA259E19]
MGKNNSNASAESRIEDLKERMEDLEERIDGLEKIIKSNLKKKRPRKKKKSKSSGESEGYTNHTYLKKTIDDAKRRYEREHKI